MAISTSPQSAKSCFAGCVRDLIANGSRGFYRRFMTMSGIIAGVLLSLGTAPLVAAPGASFTSLFPEEGIPEGWLVTQWDDLKKPAAPGVVWKVEQGVLHGSDPRGTWLMSEVEYSDFILEFEWRLGPRGNSGVALRVPMAGDPAFDGLELQMADPRYMPAESPMAPAELTGSLYRAVAPRVQVFKPEAWNRYHITCDGPLVKVVLNGETILDLNLDEQKTPTKRHDGSEAPPLKDRPRRGHIGFQELSRGGGHVEIRNARITEMRKAQARSGEAEPANK